MLIMFYFTTGFFVGAAGMMILAHPSAILISLGGQVESAAASHFCWVSWVFEQQWPTPVRPLSESPNMRTF